MYLLFLISTRQKVRKYEVISMVEKAKETSTKEIYFVKRTLSITQRSKTVVLPMDRQKVR